MKPKNQFVRVYVWEAPVRLFHWVNALCIVVLCVTGYLIAHPPALMTAHAAYASYWFGTVRFVHFVAAYVFVAALILRLYWALLGNKYARWRNFLPVTVKQWKEILQVAKADVLEINNDEVESPGHNAVAYFTYAGAFALALFQIATGFALYAATSDAWFPHLFYWVIPLFGSEYVVRVLHYAAMWVFILFVCIHVYLAAYHDYIEGNGVLSSIIGGWKFMPKKTAEAAEAQGISSLPRKPRKLL